MRDPLAAMRDGLVVSVQAPDGSPLRATPHLVAMARAAESGGALGVRAEGGAFVAAIRDAVSLPVIGLRKRRVDGSEVYITPELEDALEVAAAGADLVAVDGTLRPRPGGVPLAELVRGVSVPVLADVDSLEAGAFAREAGAAAVATTLAGYTDRGPVPAGPDLELVGRLTETLDCPVIAEGRYGSPEEVRLAFEAGAFAVVVGTAITDPLALTRRFAAAAPAGELVPTAGGTDVAPR
jgi:N-acylglucosamine-6-phosphate 2-epimerase